MLAVALRTSGKLLGVLVLEGDPDELEGQQTDVHEFAGFMALAVETADTSEREHQRVREAEVLLEVGAVLAETTELKKVLASVARNSARVTGFERCSIFVLDDSGNLVPTMSQFADGHVDEEAWKEFISIQVELPAATGVIESGLPAAYEEPETNPEMIPPEWIAPFGIKSMLYVPLAAWEQSFGVLVLDHRERRPINSQQIKMAQAVAAHGSVAIGMARLLDKETESRQRAETISKTLVVREAQQATVARLGQVALSHGDLSVLMEETVSELTEILDVEYAKILELQPDGETLLLRTGVGWRDGLRGQRHDGNRSSLSGRIHLIVLQSGHRRGPRD